MSVTLEKECPCTNLGCERRGNCVACYDFHQNKDKPSTCRRPGVTVSPEHRERVNARLRAAGRNI